MKVIGLDLSLNATGVAILEYACPVPAFSAVPTSTMFALSHKEVGNFFERMRHIERFVMGIILRERPDVIGIEAPIVGDQMTEMAWAIYALVLRAIQDSYPCMVMCPPNTSIKSIIFRSMKVTKTDSRDKAKAELSITGRLSADEADAYWVAKVAVRFFWLLTHQILPADLDIKETHAYLTEELNSKGQKKGMIHREGDLYYNWRPKQNGNL